MTENVCNSTLHPWLHTCLIVICTILKKRRIEILVPLNVWELNEQSAVTIKSREEKMMHYGDFFVDFV